MIMLSTFQKYLAAKVTRPVASRKHHNAQEQQLLQWAASLPSQTEAEQIIQLEKILINLTVMDLEDKLRLQLMAIVVTAAERLITTIHRYYIYELAGFSAEQVAHLDQVKSLYYLTISVYDEVIQREVLIQERQQPSTATNNWQWLLPTHKKPPLVLAAAIYSTLVSYQKLLYENTLFYQKPPQNMWSILNQIYDLSCQYHIVHIDLSGQVITQNANSIHQLYSQFCLHSLLNVRAMLRPSIIVLQRLLPLWANYLHVTTEPRSDTRVFVEINSDKPPDYLTANSTINPYADRHRCLFIECGPLVDYLEQRQHSLGDTKTTEYQVVTKALMLIKHRYIERKKTIPTKYSPKQRATIMTGFNNIHYQIADKQSLLSLIDAETLPVEQLPRYDTQPNQNLTSNTMAVETFDSTDSDSCFRVLQLLDNLRPEDASVSLPNTAPPPLLTQSLLLVSRPNAIGKLKCSLGVVRWLNLDTEKTEVEWQVLGHSLTACALRLNNTDTRDKRFVPTFIIASDSDLQTDPSLLVPSHHFGSQDKVIIRMGNEQKFLVLQRCLIRAKEFSQYEFTML